MKKGLILFISLFSFFFSFSQILPDTVLVLLFGVDKYQLDKEQIRQLDRLINKKASIHFVKGYADSTGGAVYNMELSRKRANAVYDYLKEHASINQETKVEHYGEKYAGDNTLAFNRRVAIWYGRNVPEEIIDETKPITEEKNEVEEKKIMDTVAATEKYELSNIYFVPDKAIIESWSFYAVDDAAKYLKRFPSCKFEIVGHVNYVLPPSLANNPKAIEPAQKLSEERAKTVYDLLVERGIPTESMTHKGVGNTQMIYKNPKNDDEKRKNMRVEILIYCNK